MQPRAHLFEYCHFCTSLLHGNGPKHRERQSLLLPIPCAAYHQMKMTKTVRNSRSLFTAERATVHEAMVGMRQARKDSGDKFEGTYIRILPAYSSATME